MVSLPTVVESGQKALYSIATTPRCREGHHSFSWIALLTLFPNLIMLSIKPRVSSTIFGVFRIIQLWIET